MACPICNSVLCDHTPKERGQESRELDEDLRREGEQLRQTAPGRKKHQRQIERDGCTNCGRILCDCDEPDDTLETEEE